MLFGGIAGGVSMPVFEFFRMTPVGDRWRYSLFVLGDEPAELVADRSRLYLGPGATVNALERTGGTLITDTAAVSGPLTSTP